MEEKIKNIVSLYTKIPAAEIGMQTVIDRSAVASSILLHRMYASLAAEGIVVENYFSIKNYGQLVSSLNGRGEILLPIDAAPADSISSGVAGTGNTIGIDVEEISSMPLVNDFREDEFYKMNFAAAEIAYCILQPDPQASFAGLFAAKEAIVKAGNQYKNKPFHTILIDHLPAGKPVHPQFEISISHTGTLAVAVAVNIQTPTSSSAASASFISAKTPQKNNSFLLFIAVSAFLLALLAVLLFLFKTS